MKLGQMHKNFSINGQRFLSKTSSIFLVSIFLLPSPLFADEDVPVFLQEFSDSLTLTRSTDWKAPNYKNQSRKLGYDKNAFQPSAALKRRFLFWKDVYAKYSSNQGVLHDAEEIDLIYSVIDLPSVASTGLPLEQVQKLRQQKVKDEKKKIERMLLKLQVYLDIGKSPDTLTGIEKKTWFALQKHKGKRKFYDATLKNRLRLQLGQKDHFARAIFFSGRYLPEIEKIFARHNLPKELTRLPFVESSFNVLAQSKVGASGIWQFMRSTAKAYMKLNRYVDERNDPFKASIAAAKLFTWSYKKVGAWPLAITGYNYGPTGIYRLSKKHRTKDLGVIIEKEKNPYFGFASKNFYASFLAALDVEKNANKYFKKPKRSLPLPISQVKLTKSVSWKNIIDWFEGNETKARLFNPQLSYRVRKGHVVLPRRYKVNIPSNSVVAIRKKISRLPSSAAPSRYKVRRGDTLGGIARRFGVSLRALMKKNSIRVANRIRVGQNIKIPR